MKNSITKILLVVCIFSFSCKKNKSADTPSESPDVHANKGFTIMTNSKDPLIVTYVDSSGSVDFFGTRSLQGIPTGISRIDVNGSKDTISIKVDNQGRITSASLSSGVTYKYLWNSKTQATLTITKNGSFNQLVTNIDFATGKSSPYQGSNGNLRVKRDKLSNLKEAEEGASETGNLKINVNSCGIPTDADVTVYAKDETGNLRGVFPATEISPGNFVANLPTSVAPQIPLAKICQAVANLLGHVCPVNELNDLPRILKLSCPAVAIAMASTGFLLPEAAVIESSCALIAVALDLICNTVGADVAPGATFADVACATKTLNRTITYPVVIYAIAHIQGQSVFSSYVKAPGDGPYPDLKVDAQGIPILNSFEFDGATGILSADLSCLPANSIVGLGEQHWDDKGNPYSYGAVENMNYISYELGEVTNGSVHQHFELQTPDYMYYFHAPATTMILHVKLPDGRTLLRQFLFSL